MIVLCLVALAATADASAASVESFVTETPPRVDPVFADAFALRRSIDEFLSLQTDMEQVRDAFATSIHQTLAKIANKRQTGRGCPEGVAGQYGRAYQAGTQYLALGHKLRDLYRDIDRAEALGDSIALTPDYRLRAKQAGQVFSQLVRDYREMRVAFHDQLATELRYAGCATNPLGAPHAMTPTSQPQADAGDPDAWDLQATPSDEVPQLSLGPKVRSKSASPSSTGAQAIWITIDNARCARSTKLFIDGLPLGEIPPKRRVSVRARAGTKELCLISEQDGSVCGEKGTLRKVYLYEGLTLTVHCPDA